MGERCLLMMRVCNSLRKVSGRGNSGHCTIRGSSKTGLANAVGCGWKEYDWVKPMGKTYGNVSSVLVLRPNMCV